MSQQVLAINFLTLDNVHGSLETLCTRLIQIVHTNIVILFKVIVYLADQLIKI